MVSCLEYIIKRPYNLAPALCGCISSFILSVCAVSIAQPISDLGVDRTTQSWLMIIAALMGSVASGFINHKKSARCSLLLADLINFFGSMFILMRGVSFVPQIGQITICLGSGISIMSIPLYIKEESSSILSDGIIIFCSFVMIIGPAVHYYLKIMYTDQVATTCLTVILPVMHFCGLYYLDISPRDFMIQGKQVHALRAIERRYLDNEVAYQFTQVKNLYHVKRSGSSSSLKLIPNRKTLSSLIKGLVPVIVSQLLGHQLVIHSIKGCLEKTEIRKEFEFLTSVFVGFASMIIEFYFIKKFGLKKTMVYCLAFITLDLFAVVSVLEFVGSSKKKGNLVLFVIFQLYVIFYAVGFNAIPELLNVKIHDEEDLCFGGAAASFVNQLINGLTILILFKDGEKNIDIKPAFTYYLFFAAAGGIAVLLVVPDASKRKKKKKLARRRGKRAIKMVIAYLVCLAERSTDGDPPNPTNSTSSG